VSKLIPLTKGQFAIVDDEDYDCLNQYKWQAYKKVKIWYAMRSPRANGKRKTILMHRQILGLVNAGYKVHTDHINHNGLDNRRCNLRRCTNSQNQQNQRSLNSHSSQFKGVRLTIYKTYQSQIIVNKKYLHLGTFKIEIKAARAYDKAAKKHFGQFAYINGV